MKKLMTWTGLMGVAAAMGALSGCASGPAFTAVEAAPEGQAQVYLYRPWQFPGSAATLKISVDGVQTESTLPNSSWERIVVSPGHHTLGLREYLNTFGCGGAQMDVAVGQTAFFAVDFSTATPIGTQSYVVCKLESRDQPTAMKDIAGLRRSK